MKLSYIVPVYNVEKYLDECLESMFNQGLREDEFEALLIDDGSTDTSLRIANQWAEHHSNIRVFHQENRGQATARNLGIDNAIGDYLMFVDSDDYLLPGKVVGLMRVLESEHLDAILYNLLVQNEDGSSFLSCLLSLEYNQVYTGEEVAMREFVFGGVCRGIYARTIFDKYSIRYGTGFAHEDTEICFRIYPRLSTILYVDAVVYYYRFNIGSTDRAKAIEKVKRNIESDAVVVSKMLGLIESQQYSTHIQKRYQEIANSSMLSFFIRVKKNSIWSKEEFHDKIKWLTDLKVYPVKGRVRSWKSRLLLRVLNVKIFLKIFLFGVKI